MRPVIAITTSLRPGGNYDLPQVELNAHYIRAVEAQGAAALLVTPASDRDSVCTLLSLAQGLMLTGGEDVDPARYGAPAHPRLGRVNHARDAMEFTAVEEALRREIPILAICRGAQLLNVAMGGTLYQDLPSELPSDTPHEQLEPWNRRSHAARVLNGSGFSRMLRTDLLSINSFHHQAVRELAPGLEATIRAEDGVIEGIEAPDLPWVYGVQWHPERGEAAEPGHVEDPDREIFRNFVAAVSSTAGAAEWSRKGSLRSA